MGRGSPARKQGRFMTKSCAKKDSIFKKNVLLCSHKHWKLKCHQLATLNQTQQSWFMWLQSIRRTTLPHSGVTVQQQDRSLLFCCNFCKESILAFPFTHPALLLTPQMQSNSVSNWIPHKLFRLLWVTRRILPQLSCQLYAHINNVRWIIDPVWWIPPILLKWMDQVNIKEEISWHSLFVIIVYEKKLFVCFCFFFVFKSAQAHCNPRVVSIPKLPHSPVLH